MRNFLAGLLACVVVLCAGYALASRNSSGTMSASNGPYISGTTINSTAVNARFSDIENEITDSLSRSGKGGMTAPLKEADGTVAAPSFSFSTEPGSGLYRIGTNDYGFSVGGAKKHEWTATGESMTVGLSQALGGTGAVVPLGSFAASLANGNFIQIQLGRSTASNDFGAVSFIPNATAALSSACLAVNGASVSSLCVDGNAKTTATGALAVTGASTLTGGLTVTPATVSIGGVTYAPFMGSCTLNGASPSTCTPGTAASSTICVGSSSGSVVAVSVAFGVLHAVSVTGPNTSTAPVNVICL